MVEWMVSRMARRTTEETMTYEEMLKALQPVQSALMHMPCEVHDRDPQEQKCLEPRPGEGVAWGDMKPQRMDAGCAAYWHLGCAVNEIQRLIRHEAIIATST